MELMNISVGIAFLAGLASFLSPCVFSLVPAYIGYLGGRSAAVASSGKDTRWLTLIHGCAFVLGFSVVFISLGMATSALGILLFSMRDWLARIGGFFVIIFGLHMTGLVRIKLFEYDLRPQSRPDRSRGLLASFLMGVFFSAGWSPCVGPILGAILTMSYNSGSLSQGAMLLIAYSAGLAIPFLVASTQIGLVTTVLKRYGKVTRYVEIAMGILLIVIGVLLMVGRFSQLSTLGSFLGNYDEIALGRFILLAFISLTFLGLIPAYIARNRGRNFIDWWFFGAGLFLVALPMALMLKDKPAGQEILNEK
jgi:cytochrome c-type biogenesis protein